MKSYDSALRAAIGLVVSCSCLASAQAGDWPQWRGPQRTGVVPDAKAITKLPKESKTAWQLTAGPGHAGPVVTGDKLIFLDEVGGKEVVHALDAANGKELWKQEYGESAEYSNFDPGPRCTPLVDGDRVYIQSGRGEFRCLSVKDGKIVWRFNFEKDFGATWFGNKGENPDAKETASRRHGNNGAPVIDGNRIFVAVGDPAGATLVAFDKLTGKKIWQVGDDNTAYSSLMVGTIAGIRQVVHYTADALMGVDAASGKMLWRVPIKTGAKRHTVTPILLEDGVIVSSHTVGMIRFKITKTATGANAEQMWVNKNLQTMLSTPVIVNGSLYGLGTTRGKNTDFVCVDLTTGKERWAQPLVYADYASIIAVADSLLVLNSTGELFLLKANPQKYEELGRVQVCGKTWSFPAYANGKLYVRDARQMLALPLE